MLSIDKALKLAVFASLITFVAGCGPAVEQLEKQTIRPVKLFTVEDPRQSWIRQFPGKVVASKSAEMSFRVAGNLTELKNLASTKVKQGDVLARLDDVDAKNELESRAAAYDLAVAEHTRNKILFKKGLVSKAILDQMQAQLRAAKAALSAARDQLSYAVLKAPFDGVIANVSVENHQYVKARDLIMLLESRDNVDISVEVPEQFVANLAENPNPNGYLSQVTFPALPGKVFEVSFKEASLTPTPGSQTYTVVATMPKPTGFRLQQGMTASLTIDFSKLNTVLPRKERLIIPVSAIVYPDDKSTNKAHVWRYDANTSQVKIVDVSLGAIGADGIEIIDGLMPEDIVVSAGIHRLKDGQLVKPWVVEQGL
ncbi:MAG: efflux RND transporter periplasmic adaptor subunit [Psychrobium sp.]